MSRKITDGKIRAGQTLVVSKRLAGMLRGMVEIEALWARDSKKWTELERMSTAVWVNGEAKEKIADEVLALYRQQYKPEVKK